MKLLSLLENIGQFDEVLIAPHADERMLERFLAQMAFPLMLTTRDMPLGEYKKVGTYILSKEERELIINKVNDFLNFELPAGKRYGVVFHTFDVYDTKGKSVFYPKLDLKHQTVSDIVRKDGRLYITNKQNGGSIGDVLFAIVVDNQVETFYFNRSHSMSDKKHRVDAIINAENASSLSNFKKQKNPPQFV